MSQVTSQKLDGDTITANYIDGESVVSADYIYRVPPNSAPMFAEGFSMDNNRIFGTVPGTTKSHQVNEPRIIVNPTNPNELVMWYSGWSSGAAATSGLWRCTASIDSPHIWTNQQQLLTGAESGIGYIRIGAAIYDSGTYYFYLSGAPSGVYLATSTDGFNLSPLVQVLSQEGEGRDDEAPISLGSVYKDGATWYMVYTLNGTGSYRAASASDAFTWTKIGEGDILIPEVGPDQGGIEAHQLLKVAGNFVIMYEGYSGSVFSNQCAYSGDILGPYTKLGIVQGPNLSSEFAQRHTATPFAIQINGLWYQYFQGTNAVSYIDGPWQMGISYFNY